MKFARKFKATWSNGVEREFRASSFAQEKNIKKGIENWCEQKNFKKPTWIDEVYGYDYNLNW